MAHTYAPLMDVEFKVRRTSGEIEGGWQIKSPPLVLWREGREKLLCINKKNDIKWCNIDDLLQINAFTDDNVAARDDNASNASRNLCLVCNVDMGACNPRQLCGKYMCRNE